MVANFRFCFNWNVTSNYIEFNLSNFWISMHVIKKCFDVKWYFLKLILKEYLQWNGERAGLLILTFNSN